MQWLNTKRHPLTGEADGDHTTIMADLAGWEAAVGNGREDRCWEAQEIAKVGEGLAGAKLRSGERRTSMEGSCAPGLARKPQGHGQLPTPRSSPKPCGYEREARPGHRDALGRFWFPPGGS